MTEVGPESLGPPQRYWEPPLAPGMPEAFLTPLTAVRPRFRRLPAPPPPEPRPPTEWVQRVAVVLLEVVHRKRPLNQLRGVASPRVIDQLGMRRQVVLARAAQEPLRVTSVRVSPNSARTMEVGVTYSRGERFFPMALRLELTKQGWLATACELGPG